MNKNNEVISLAKELIRRPTITPKDLGCQEIFKDKLLKLGFKCEDMIFDDTTNLWARKGSKSPLLVFAGHTDVVPTGPLEQWDLPPFAAVESDGYIHGRGAADMKGSLASMLVAIENFVKDNPNFNGSLGLLITSDEEGPFINGTTKVVDTLMARNELIDMCIVGEPSSTNFVGDVIKNGRRGSVSGKLIVKGVQGHVAYPHLAKNAIHLSSQIINKLTEIKWDSGNEFFPPTSFQISNINGGTGAANVIPGDCEISFNLRHSNETDAENIKNTIERVINDLDIEFSIDWQINGLPFLTESGPLLDAVKDAVKEVNNIDAKVLTTGGTSDGRFIAKMGAQVVELGPVNKTIHKLNEKVKTDDLTSLYEMYYKIIEKVML